MLTYSPIDVIVSFGGKEISGFPDGEFINIKREGKPFTYTRAMDGALSVAVSRNSTYTVELTLAQSSPSNDYLNLIKDVLMKSLGKKRQTSSLTRILSKLPLLIKDRNGTTTFFAKDVFFDEEPEVKFSNGMEVRHWTLRCYNVTTIIGGNNEDSLTADLNRLNAILGLVK